MPSEIVVLGLDGGTFDVALPLVRAGKMPHLERLLADGFHGRLRSTIHPITAAAWTSFATGCNPGKHGIFDFERPEEGSYSFRLNSARDRGAEPFWGAMSQAGKRIAVVNVPFTYPPDRVNGIVIAGFDAPGAKRDMASPPEIFDELTTRFGHYSPDWTFPAGERFDERRYLRHVEETIDARTEVSLYLLEREAWDFFMTVYGSLDHVQHIYFGAGERGMQIIESTYRQFDRALGRYLGHLGGRGHLFILSDHGFGPLRKVFFLDRWLEQEGLLRFEDGFAQVSHGLLASARRLLKHLLPVRIRSTLRGKIPMVRDFLAAHTGRPGIDWDHTLAYTGGMYGNIYLNVESRRPQGCVPLCEYENLRERIAEKLARVRNPDTGAPLVERVHRREDLYDGPFVQCAPDLVIQWKDYATYTHHGLDEGGRLFSDRLHLDASDCPHTGTHRIEGMLVAAGENVRHGTGDKAALVDLAPTFLHMLGLSVPAVMDGRVLVESLTDEWRAQHPVCREKGGRAVGGTPTEGREPSPEEKAAIEERLRSLGYL